MIRIYNAQDTFHRNFVDFLDTSKFVIVDDIRISDVILLLGDQDLKNRINNILTLMTKFQRLIIEPTNLTIKDKRVRILNLRRNDPSTIDFTNYMYHARISHIDIVTRESNAFLVSHLMSALVVVKMLIGNSIFTQSSLRQSSNTHSIHCNGFNKRENLTFSIYVSDVTTYYEDTVSVYMVDGSKFVFTNPDNQHTYVQRYCCAFEQFILMNRPDQDYYKIISKIESMRRISGFDGSTEFGNRRRTTNRDATSKR